MTFPKSTPIDHNHPDLQYPGWNIGWKRPGDDHDPIMGALIRRQVQTDADASFDEVVGQYLYKQSSSPEFKGRTLRQVFDEKIGARELVDAQVEHTIKHTSPEEVWSEWMGNPYTRKADDGRIEWVSYVPGLTLFDGYGDFPVLEDADFIVNIEASGDIPGLPLKITIESPIGKDILPPHPDMPNDETWLYRMFDEDENLLYVGISKDAFIRFSQHAREKPWINDVARWTRKKFNTRNAALNAEKKAIKAERPLYNIAHNEGDK